MYLYPPNINWKSEFQKEKELLTSKFEDNIEIHHIGSTAITGLYAKNCIDILGVVNDISDISKVKQHIIKLGYSYKGEYGISGREYFSKKQRKVHLHFFQYDDINVEKHLNFVKVMQNNSFLITELNQLKQILHAKHPQNKDAYQNGKEPFYSRINKML
jgi:GrpB-like predicted nucleotidyltransferase (UPF0157 family)